VISKAQARLEIVLWGILLLTFTQLMADFFEAIYAFGLLGTSIPVEMVSLLLMFSPAVLLLFPQGLPGWTTLLLGQGALLCRALEPMLDTRGRMLVSGLGVACFMAFWPAALHRQARERRSPGAFPWVGGMILAVALSIGLRALGSGVDLSTDIHPIVGWVLAGLASALSFVRFGTRQARTPPGRGQERPEGDSRGSAWRIAGLCLGLSGVLAILGSTLAVPNVLARWTGADYVVVVAAVALALGGLAILLTAGRPLAAILTPQAVLAWNALFVLAMALTLLAHQVRFASDPALYPLSAPAVRWWHHVPLAVMLLSSPVLYIDLSLYLQQLVDERPTLRALGAGFLLFSLFYLLVTLGQIFTTVYDYVPVVGPFFRDRLWLVYLAAGAGATVPVLLVRRPTFGRWQDVQGTWLLPGAVLLIGVAAVAGAVVTAPRPGLPAPKETLRVCTYNIQQGYDAGGLENYDGQLALLRQVEADVIGLQESDTNRISGGNSDVVRYLADRLNMYSYYGPKTVPGTFGIALLSRYPIEHPRTFYMYSAGEQTATIEAQIRLGERTLRVYVTHLGNEGPIVQQEAILQEVAGQENVVLMGDFNFCPDTAQCRLTREAFDDAWLLRWPDGVDGQGRSFPRRIDHVFVSPGTAVVDAQYITDPESDHPALIVEIVP
jgi:endonuclease/exonuclease/phosphatase family metal-dependent hydrolase